VNICSLSFARTPRGLRRDGQKLAYVYFEDVPRQATAAKLLTKDEAREIAANFAKLPEIG
jgi:hypothetical protein